VQPLADCAFDHQQAGRLVALARGEHLLDLGAAEHVLDLERAEHAGHFHEDDADHAHHEVPPSLAQRVAPFLAMLREAKAAQADVHWGF